MNKSAVVLFNLGGPDSLEAVEPFLYNLFLDPDIISIPAGRFFRKKIAKLISTKRSQFVCKQYEQIGGKSPINEWTEKQRSMLESSLAESGYSVDVFTGMRYWNPFISEAARKIDQGSYTKIILMPLFPHYSITTTGSSYSEWKRVYSGDHDIVELVREFCENQKYIGAINERIDQGIQKFPQAVRDNVELIFSAHGVPVSVIKKGDPYKDHIERTVASVMNNRTDGREHNLCFQSKVGPMKWLKPSTDDTIMERARSGKKHLLVIPISFVSDHLETLFELDIEYRHTAMEAGVENYIVTGGINDSTLFIEALIEEIAKRL
ncbi:ferrochelatase [candidate division KSB1 bacterium]